VDASTILSVIALSALLVPCSQKDVVEAHKTAVPPLVSLNLLPPVVPLILRIYRK
jgi:hypothetical protein